MFAAFDLPALGDWLTQHEFSGPNAAALANAEAGFRSSDGFSFIGIEPPYLRIEAGELGFHAIRFGRMVSSGHQYRLKASQEDWLVIAWPDSGVLCTTSDRGMVSAYPGQCLVIPPGRRTVSALPLGERFRSTRLLISASALKRAFAGVGISPDAIVTCACVSRDTVFGGLLYAIARELMRSTAERAATRLMTAAYEATELAIAALAMSFLLEAGAIGDIEADADPALRIVRSAEALLRQSYADEISIEQLCRELEIGERSLQLAFGRVRGFSPRDYLQELRLEKARQLLMSASADNAVTEAAMIAGFSHLGRFSGFYRRRYGESPSESLRRVRSPIS